jgi:hypothetical protein
MPTTPQPEWSSYQLPACRIKSAPCHRSACLSILKQLTACQANREEAELAKAAERLEMHREKRLLLPYRLSSL